MPKLYQGFKDAIRNDDFVYFNQLLENPLMASTMHFENNFALKEVTKKGILSSVKELLKIRSVWLTFNDDEMMHMADNYSNHPGIQRFIANTAFARFQHFLTTSSMHDLPYVMQMFEQSHFLANNAARNNNILIKSAIQKGAHSAVTVLLKNNAVAEHCGLNELFLALKFSNHPGIVRALLRNPAVAKLVGDEKIIIESALANGNFSNCTSELRCLKGITDKSALATEQVEAEQISALAKNSLFTPAAPPSSPLTPILEDDMRLEMF
jgi:hypothetical protein